MSQIVINALIQGSLLALLAVGLTLVQGTLNFANIAHLELATIGAYAAVALTGVGLPLVPSAAVSVVITAALAILGYRLLFRRLLRSGPMIAMVGSLSLSIVLRAALQLVFGSQPRSLPLPLERAVSIDGGLITPNQIRIIILALLLLGVTLGLLKWTPMGKRVRAVAANPELAAVSGINRARVIDGVWVIAACLASTAGVLLATESVASPDMGFNELLPVFAVAIVGGLGSPAGAIAAAYLLSLVEAVVLNMHFGWFTGGTGQLPVSYGPAISFVLLIAVLLFRPQGMFGRAGRRA